MNKKYTPADIEKVSCDVCRKEVPLSEATTPEAVDYVAHFCGLECYTQWKREHDQAGQRGKTSQK